MDACQCRLRIIQKNQIACAMERVELVKKICLLYRQKYLSRTAMVIDQTHIPHNRIVLQEVTRQYLFNLRIITYGL